MITILFTLVAFAAFFGLMGIGLWVNGRELKGSCGGPKTLEDGSVVCCQDSSVPCERSPSSPVS